MNKTIHHGWSAVLLLLVLLAAFALRIFRLDVQSIWWDESISLHLATSTLGEILANRVRNIHPPLYFVLLKGWVVLAGATPFGGRYLSTLASFLQVAAVYAVSRRWFGRPTAWVALGLITLSPLSVIYGQETRVYAILPLIYLALLALTTSLLRAEGQPAAGQAGGFSTRWLWLGVIEWLGLHLHYITIFAVVYLTVWAALSLYRQKRRADLRRWLGTQLLVGLASLPWFAAVLLNWGRVQNEANTGSFLAEPAPPAFLLSQVWGFHLTGLTGLLGRPEVRLLSGLALLFFSLLLLLRLYQPSSRRLSARYLAHWLIPLSSALFVWSVRSFSHPRYVSIYAVGLIPLLAALLQPRWTAWKRSVGRRLLSSTLVLLLTAVLLSLSFWSLAHYFYNPAVAKTDIRRAARYLEEAAGSEDVIIVPDTDWSLFFEYRGQTPVVMPGLIHQAEEDVVWPNLGRATEGRRRAFLLSYPRGFYDWQGLLPFALEKAGSLVAETNFDGLSVRTYALEQPVGRPQPGPEETRFGPLRLAAAWVEPAVPAGSAITLALHWQLPAPDGARYAAALRLLDDDGWLLAAEDTLLLDEDGRPTDYWAPDAMVTTYHLLPLTPGTPPLTYTVGLGVYARDEDGPRSVDVLDAHGAPQGQQLRLAQVQLLPSLLAGNPYGVGRRPPALPEAAEVADGLALTASSIEGKTLSPGQTVIVHLQWQADRPLPDLRPRLSLWQAGRTVAAAAEAPAQGRYPTHLWRAGETVLEHRFLVVPAEAAPGPAEVVLSLAGHQVALGEVEITSGLHLFEPPVVTYPLEVQFGQVARLIGYDLPRQTFDTAEPVPLTLYWESLAGGITVDYTVFTHVLAADGHLIGQHDAPPDNGRRPTSSWLAGEFIVDAHALTFRETDYSGPARIEIGLYDPLTGTRLLTQDGRDFIYLPANLTIQPNQQEE